MLKTFEIVKPFESVQNNLKLSDYVNLVESNTTLKLVPLKLGVPSTYGDVDPYYKI